MHTYGVNFANANLLI